MKLIDPQPMETLPEKGEVFVRHKSGDVYEEHVIYLRYTLYPGDYEAWSYTATTMEDEDEAV